MDCSNCGAPLPPQSNICPFCKTLNDTDLRAVRRDVRSGGETQRKCPHCDVNLRAVYVGVDGGFVVDRCCECMGIFFDPGEIEVLSEAAVAGVYEVDLQRLTAIAEEETVAVDRPVRYISCPICGKFMNRKNYGSRSGVVVDECRDHGIWLDAGELGQLLKWIKAGGRILVEKKKEEATKAKDRERRAAARTAEHEAYDNIPDYGFDGSPLVGLVRLLFRLLG